MLMAKKNISVSVKIKDLERMKINISMSEEKNLRLSIYFELINLRVLKYYLRNLQFCCKELDESQIPLNFYTET